MVQYTISSKLWSQRYYNELLLDGAVLAIEVYTSNTVIVAGGFRKVGNLTNLNNIVLLQYPTLEWTPFDGGVFGIVTCLQVIDTSVYVGGIFQFIGNTEKYASIAKYTPDSGWTNVGNGISRNDPLSKTKRPSVYDIKLSGDNKFLYVGGAFTKVMIQIIFHFVYLY